MGLSGPEEPGHISVGDTRAAGSGGGSDPGLALSAHASLPPGPFPTYVAGTGEAGSLQHAGPPAENDVSFSPCGPSACGRSSLSVQEHAWLASGVPCTVVCSAHVTNRIACSLSHVRHGGLACLVVFAGARGGGKEGAFHPPAGEGSSDHPPPNLDPCGPTSLAIRVRAGEVFLVVGELRLELLARASALRM